MPTKTNSAPRAKETREAQTYDVCDTADQAANTTANADMPEKPTSERRVAYRPKTVDLDPNMYVPVRNGFNGKLVYISRKSGERYVWEHFGDEQDVELRELRAAKTSYKAFYVNNWFLIDDPDVIEYLGVERFYKNALSYEDFDSLFDMSPEEIEQKISLLSNGQKTSLKYRARQLIKEGKIDSIKVINMLERCLGIELIER